MTACSSYLVELCLVSVKRLKLCYIYIFIFVAHGKIVPGSKFEGTFSSYNRYLLVGTTEVE